MKTKRPDWNSYFMLIAKIVSSRSTCNSRPIGAVITKNNQILATGYVGAMPGSAHCIDQPDMENGEPFCFRRATGVGDTDKYNFCKSTHAEANAIAQAARYGIPIEGSTLYTTLAPCYVCLKLIATARISAVYYEHNYDSVTPERDQFWDNEIRNAGLIIYEQLIITPETYEYCLSNIHQPTSKRRLRSTP